MSTFVEVVRKATKKVHMLNIGNCYSLCIYIYINNTETNLFIIYFFHQPKNDDDFINIYSLSKDSIDEKVPRSINERISEHFPSKHEHILPN